ncbi:MAG: hypothetical protein LBL48_11200 [Azoarcus sp.]|jgi:hypothetical protein|nr:hypothetical protein [Azoarcus sp.]
MLLPFLGFGIGMVLGDKFNMPDGPEGMIVSTCVIIGSAIAFALGLILNSPSKVVEQARASGMPEDEVTRLADSWKNRHTLYDMPMQWPGLVGILFGLLLFYVAWQEDHGGLPAILEEILMPLSIAGLLFAFCLAVTWTKRRKK